MADVLLKNTISTVGATDKRKRDVAAIEAG
jgi:hypothetical protein